MRSTSSLKIAASFVVLGVVVTACSGGSAGSETVTRATTAGEWATWDSVEALAEDSELIILGIVKERIGEFDVVEENGSVAKTDVVHLVAVEDVLKGSEIAAGDTIPVGYWAIEEPNVSPLVPNDQLVLFLAPYDFGGQLKGGWVPLSSDTGVFEVVGSDQIESRGVVGPTANLRLSLSDLADLISG